MKYEEMLWYSERLRREMRIKIYGHYGQAVLTFPCYNQQSNDLYDYGMVTR